MVIIMVITNTIIIIIIIIILIIDHQGSLYKSLRPLPYTQQLEKDFPHLFRLMIYHLHQTLIIIFIIIIIIIFVVIMIIAVIFVIIIIIIYLSLQVTYSPGMALPKEKRKSTKGE